MDLSAGAAWVYTMGANDHGQLGIDRRKTGSSEEELQLIDLVRRPRLPSHLTPHPSPLTLPGFDFRAISFESGDQSCLMRGVALSDAGAADGGVIYLGIQPICPARSRSTSLSSLLTAPFFTAAADC